MIIFFKIYITFLLQLLDFKDLWLKKHYLVTKVYKFVCFLGCLIIKMILEKQDKKIMQIRGKQKYRHKGLREKSVNTITGEIKYKRAIYEVVEDDVRKTVYLLDEQLQINKDGKVSSNLVEKVIEIVPIKDSYRKVEIVIAETTNTSLSYEKIRKMIINIGDKITNKEKEKRKLYDKKQLIAGLKEITALFEADGIWINLQGKDRNKRLEEK